MLSAAQLTGRFAAARLDQWPVRLLDLSHARLLGWGIVCGLGYGAVMGSFGGFGGERLWQVFFSAAKVPLLLLVTFTICLPSFFVLNTLLGVRADFAQSVRALVATQAALSVILLSLSPYTALWYVSSTDYSAAILFNGLMFGVASLSGQWLLRRYYQPLMARNARHRLLLRVWLALYVFVGIQMAWVLRPFVGQPALPVQFFREDAWGNAYVTTAQLIWRLVAPGR
ncbi:MAG: hypothetical protein HYY24_02865 [Verrucomicrobia bacterium]|nr:hypothetical protein [Verrucomicrobiota bacterium]